MASGLLTVVSVAVLLPSAILLADGLSVKEVLKQVQSLKTKGPLHVTIAILNSRGNSTTSFSAGRSNAMGGRLAKLERQNVQLMEQVKAMQQAMMRSQRCSWSQLGYRQGSWWSRWTKKNKGELRRMTFTKKQSSTGLRIVYSTNIREYYAGKHSRWVVRIDGQDCKTPSRLEIGTYHYRKNNMYFPAVIMGTCTATSRGAIGKGKHTITVHVFSTNGASGWAANNFLEVREMCIENQ